VRERKGKYAMIAVAVFLVALVLIVIAVVVVGANRIARDK
jgi:hypothetical protein